jgi:type IV pilus biogenesis protein CpaD/CtpE
VARNIELTKIVDTFASAASFAIAVGLLLCGCDKQRQYRPKNDDYVPETSRIETREVKRVYFFVTPPNFEISPSTATSMGRVLREAHNTGIENVGYLLVSNQPITAKIQDRARNQIHRVMCENGFISSRISDSGVCVYNDAKVGIRIEILRYDVKEPDCSIWSEYIGDIDTSKNLPKYSASTAYNMAQMISNKGDLVMPRKYKGQETSKAIAAMGKAGSSGGGSGASSISSAGSTGGSASSSAISSSSSGSSAGIK